MSDVNANINISINSSQALGQLRALQSQISQFNQSVIAGNAAAAASQKSLTANLAAQIGATKGFTTSMVNVESSVSRLGNAIDKNKLSLGQYFRYGAAASGTFGKSMREHAEIMELAGDRVKRLQTQYIAMGQAQNGMQKAMAVRPLQLHNADSAIGIQRQQIFNKLMHDGSTSMVNWGKNTQWAGRQLMVGFTVPLTIFGGIAGKIFMDLEKQIVQFKRVYGDLQTTPAEKAGMVEEVKALGKEFTKYGIAVNDTIALAAKAAATGATGADLMAVTTEATRLATLGQIDYQQALDATISLQTAFGVSSKDLAQTTDFLNAVENQTVTSLDDITQAIPLVAPVIRGLGGDVKDLAVFLTAMREGGVNANEGANALKSGLASMINPTKAAREQLALMKIDIDGISNRNKGDIQGFVLEFGKALGTLSKFERQQTLAKVFGKYQFARMGALFSNISKEGSQAQRVIDLTGESVKDLAKLSEGELGQLEEAVGVKFTAAVEKLKLAIAPVGEAFLKIATPIIEFATMLADKFNNLPDGMKTFITWGVAIGGVVIPAVVMLVGLFANFLGQMIKMGNAVRMLFGKTRGLGSALQYLSGEELDAMAASASLEGQTNSLTGSLTVQRAAVLNLARAYGTYASRASAAAMALPQGFRGGKGTAPAKYATGGFVAGSGNKDSEPALLMPGEFVVRKDAAQKNRDLLIAMNSGMLKGYALGSEPTARTHLTSRVEMTTAGALALPNIIDSAKRTLGVIHQIEEALGRSISSIAKVSNLIVELPAQFNDRMRNGVSQADFTSEFSSAGIDKYRSTLAITGQNFEQMAPHLRELDTALLSAAQEYDTIGDSNIGEVTRKAFDRLPPATREALREVELLSQEYNNLRVTVSSLDDATKREIQELTGANGQNLGYRVAQEEGSDRVRISRNGEDVASLRTRQETLSSGRTYRRSPLMFNTSEIGPEMISAARTAGLAAGEQGGQAFMDAFGSSLHEAGGKSREILSAAMTEGLDPADARRFLVASGFSDSTARKMASELREAMVQTLGDPVEEAINGPRNSPHPAVPRAGRQDGAAYRESFEAAAGNPRESVVSGRGRRSATRPQGPSGMTNDQITQTAIIERQVARTRRTATRQGTLSPIALRSGEEATRIQSIRSAQPSALVEKGNRSYAEAMQRSSSQIKSSSSRFQGSLDLASRSMKTFGASLMSGSSKITGSMFALDGLVFGLSMMDNSIGQFAQKILPVVFGLQALQMMLPIISNPLALLGIAVVGLTAGIIVMTNRAHDNQAKMIQHSIAVQGSAKAFDELAKDLGKIKPSEKFNTLISGVKTKEDQEALKEAQAFLETESGKGMVSRASGLSGTQRVSSIKNELLQSMALDIISPKQAKAIAQSLSIALKDPVLGIALVGSISEHIRGSGSEIKSSVAFMLKSVSDDISSTTGGLGGALEKTKRLEELLAIRAKGISKSEDAEGNVTVNTGITRQEEEELQRLQETESDYKNITIALGPLLNSSKKLAEMQAFLNLQFRQGHLALKDYTSASKAIQKENTRIADSINSLIDLNEDNASFNFADKLRQSAEALGMTSEELDQIDTQVNAIVGVLNDMKSSVDTTAIGDAVRYGLTAGTMSIGDAASIPELMKNQKFKTQIEVAVNSGDVQKIGETITMLNQINAMPEPIKSEILMDWNTQDFKTPEEFLAWQQKALTNATYFASNPKLSAQTYTALKEGSLTNRQASGLEKTYAKGEESMGAAFNVKGLKDLKEADKWYNKFNKAKDIKKVLGLEDQWSEAFRAFGITYAQFAALPNIKKAAIMLNVQAYMTLIEQYDDAKKLMADADDLTNRMMGKAQGEAFATNVEGLKTGTQEIVGKTPKTPAVTTPEGGSGSSGGGGEQKEDPLASYKEMWKSINEKLKLYTNIEKVLKKLKSKKDQLEKALPQLRYKNSLASEMRQAGASEALVADLLGKGYKEAKKIFDTLKKRNKLNVASKAMLMGNVGNATSELAREGKLNAARTRATENLKAQGVSDEIIEEITQNEDIVEFFGKKKNMKSKMWQDYIFWAKQAKVTTEDLTESIEKQDDILGQADDMMQRQFEALERQTEAKYKALQYDGMTVDAINKQIQANEDLIRTYQDSIDAKREQIDDNERLNDLDQQAIEDQNRLISLEQEKIDNLSREDELRSRVSSALSRELELMSRQETAIRDAYQKRIDALDEVASLNERIAQAQQDQLSISKALSVGDVYAAAEAAAQMQANQVAFASEQTKTGLQKGMDNAVSGLTSSSGLTRAQIEAQIQSIQDQSYQTSLQIRDIEDYIYNLKETKIEPIEERIYQRNLLNRALQNEIYLIQESSIEPLENQNKAYDRIVASHERQLALELATLEVGGMTKEIWDAKVTSLEAQIAAAKDLTTPLKNLIDNYDAIALAAEAAAEEIRKLYELQGQKVTSDIGAAAAGVAGPDGTTTFTNTGASAPLNNTATWHPYGAGMTGGWYAAGGVVGDGARDSVNAMLTPGEFVIRKASVDKYGEAMFQKINQGSFSVPKYSTGRTEANAPVARMQQSTSINAPVYNSYSVNVTANTTSSADDIARTVISKIKTIENSNIRRINGY